MAWININEWQAVYQQLGVHANNNRILGKQNEVIFSLLHRKSFEYQTSIHSNMNKLDFIEQSRSTIDMSTNPSFNLQINIHFLIINHSNRDICRI